MTKGSIIKIGEIAIQEKAIDPFALAISSYGKKITKL